MCMRAKVVILVVLLFAAAPFAFALSLTEVDVNVGLLFIGSSPPPGYGAPSPLLQTIGVSFPMSLGGPWYMEPTIEFFGTNYEWTAAAGSTVSRAVPATIEAAAGFFTLGTIITCQFGGMWPVAPTVKLGGSLGLDFVLRFPLELSNNDSTSVAGRGPALSYFFGAGRFLLPETRFVVRWQVFEPVALVFTLRGMYPVFHLWDGEGLPFYDQLMTALDLGFAIKLGGGKPKPAAPADAAPAASK